MKCLLISLRLLLGISEETYWIQHYWIRCKGDKSVWMSVLAPPPVVLVTLREMSGDCPLVLVNSPTHFRTLRDS